MKHFIFSLALVCVSGLSMGQQNKVYVGLSYSPCVTSMTNPTFSFGSQSFKFANNLFAEIGYKLTNNIYANAGIGFQTTKQLINTDVNGQLDFERLEQTHIQRSVLATTGFTYNIGDFFIHPEIGIGWIAQNKLKDLFFLTNGTVIGRTWTDESNFYKVNSPTVPLILNLGHEMKYSHFSILLGVHGYYMLNKVGDHSLIDGHAFGFGLLTGVKF